MYCIWDKANNRVSQGPWHKLPGKVQWSDGSITMPCELNMEHGDEVVVPFTPQDPPPDWYEVSQVSVDFNGTEVIETATYVRTWFPRDLDVKAEARNRFFSAYSREHLIEALIDYPELKEIKDSGGTFTTAQQARWDELRDMRQKRQAIQQAAKTILEMNPIPDDYDDDVRWP